MDKQIDGYKPPEIDGASRRRQTSARRRRRHELSFPPDFDDDSIARVADQIGARHAEQESADAVDDLADRDE
jgi:hypothetical protein